MNTMHVNLWLDDLLITITHPIINASGFAGKSILVMVYISSRLTSVPAIFQAIIKLLVTSVLWEENNINLIK